MTEEQLEHLSSQYELANKLPQIYNTKHFKTFEDFMIYVENTGMYQLEKYPLYSRESTGGLGFYTEIEIRKGWLE